MSIRSMEDFLKENNRLKKCLSKMETANSELKDQLEFYKIPKLRTNATSDVVRPSKTQMKYIKRRIQVALEKINDDINKLGLNLNEITIKECTPGIKAHTVPINYSSSQKKASIRHILYFKDKALLSDDQYHTIRKGWNISDSIPPLNQIRQERKNYKKEMMELNTAGNGLYFEPVKLIKEKILLFLKKNSETVVDNNIIIKLSCDGTKIARRVKLINLVFSIINEDKADSVNCCYRIGLFKIIKEDYETIKTWLPEIFERIKKLRKVYFDSNNKLLFDQRDSANFIEYNIQYYFCADWKAAAEIRGYYAANGNYPCLYCTVDSSQNPTYLNFKGKCI